MYFLILILIIIFIVYNITGLYLILPLILAIANFTISTFNLIFDPYNKGHRLIQSISLAFIIFIIVLNFKELILSDNSYKCLFILPLSVNKITFLDEFYWYWKNEINIFYFSQAKYIRLYMVNDSEVIDFLSNLEDNKSYIIELNLVIDWDAFDMGDPALILSKPILVSKESNSRLLTEFINNRIISSCSMYSIHLEEQVLEKVGVLLKYKEIKLPI